MIRVQRAGISFLALLGLAASAPPGAGKPLPYFPSRVFSDERRIDTSRARWYSDELQLMREPSLWARTLEPRLTAYRWTWLRSFHPAAAVRIEQQGETATLTVKYRNAFRGSGGEYFHPAPPVPQPPPHLTIVRSRRLSDREWLGFRKQLAQCDFWRLPTPDDGPLADDGARWIMEGVEDGRYHLVDRQSPDEKSSPSTRAFRECCLYLLKLSGLKIPPDDLY